MDFKQRKLALKSLAEKIKIEDRSQEETIADVFESLIDDSNFPKRLYLPLGNGEGLSGYQKHKDFPVIIQYKDKLSEVDSWQDFYQFYLEHKTSV